MQNRRWCFIISLIGLSCYGSQKNEPEGGYLTDLMRKKAARQQSKAAAQDLVTYQLADLEAGLPTTSAATPLLLQQSYGAVDNKAYPQAKLPSPTDTHKAIATALKEKSGLLLSSDAIAQAVAKHTAAHAGHLDKLQKLNQPTRKKKLASADSAQDETSTSSPTASESLTQEVESIGQCILIDAANAAIKDLGLKTQLSESKAATSEEKAIANALWAKIGKIGIPVATIAGACISHVIQKYT